MELPIAPISRIVKKSSEGYRWSPGAIRLIAESAESHISEFSQKAVLIAQNAGRKTVQEDDVKLITNLG